MILFFVLGLSTLCKRPHHFESSSLVIFHRRCGGIHCFSIFPNVATSSFDFFVPLLYLSITSSSWCELYFYIKIHCYCSFISFTIFFSSAFLPQLIEKKRNQASKLAASSFALRNSVQLFKHLSDRRLATADTCQFQKFNIPSLISRIMHCSDSPSYIFHPRSPQLTSCQFKQAPFFVFGPLQKCPALFF